MTDRHIEIVRIPLLASPPAEFIAAVSLLLGRSVSSLFHESGNVADHAGILNAMEQKAFPAEDETEDKLNRWGALTVVAVLVVPLLVFAARVGVSGWMLVFVYFIGWPAWLAYYGFACWMVPGFWLRDSKFSRAAPTTVRLSVVGLLWACLAAMAFFGVFMSDGGDEDSWRSPIEKTLDFDADSSATPQWLQLADHLSYFALLLAAVLFCAAAGLYLGARLWGSPSTSTDTSNDVPTPE